MRTAFVLVCLILLLWRAGAQEAPDTDEGSPEKAASGRIVIHYVQKEMWIPARQTSVGSFDPRHVGQRRGAGPGDAMGAAESGDVVRAAWICRDCGYQKRI